MQWHLAWRLAATTVAAVACCCHAFLLPPITSSPSSPSRPRLVALPPVHASTAALSRKGRRGAHLPLYARLKNTGNKVDMDQDELQRLLQAFLRGERSSMEEYEEQRRLQAEEAEEASQGLFGKVKHVFRGIMSKAPLLLVAPVVLWASIQLSGLAVALALTSAVVVAGFALPPMFTMTFLMPLVVLMLVGTFVFPILPFAIIGFLPGFVLLPLLFLGGVFWLTQFSGFSFSSSRSGGGLMGGEEGGSWPWGESSFSWISINGDEGEEDGLGRGGGRRAGGGGVIDVKAIAADDDEDEEEDGGGKGGDLEDFDRRLRG